MVNPSIDHSNGGSGVIQPQSALQSRRSATGGSAASRRQPGTRRLLERRREQPRSVLYEPGPGRRNIGVRPVGDEQLLETTRHERHHHLHRRTGHVPVAMTRPRRHRTKSPIDTQRTSSPIRNSSPPDLIRTSPRSERLLDQLMTMRTEPKSSSSTPAATVHSITEYAPPVDAEETRIRRRSGPSSNASPSLDDTTRSPVMTSSVDTTIEATADHSIDASRRSNSPTYRHPRPSAEDEHLVAPRRGDQTAQGMPRPEI